MDARAEVTAYEPPWRFAYVEKWDGVDFPTEFLVEARAGGTCVVRVVSSGVGEGEEWDRALEGLDHGWRAFLDNLRLYREHVGGGPGSQVVADALLPGGEPAAALRGLLGALGLPEDAAVGDRVATAGDDAPGFAGVVERVTDVDLAIREPGGRLVVLGAFGWEEGVMVRLQAYVYGDDAISRATGLEPEWRAWIAERFGPSRVA